MEISAKTVGLITVLVLLGIMLISGLTFQSQFEDHKVIFKEGPLEKNTKLQIKPGETYRYAYVMNQSGLNMTYSTGSGTDCTLIVLMESVNHSEICIDEDGMDEGGSNATYTNPAVLLFKPWMLALDDGWSWNTSMYMEFDNDEHYLMDVNYRVLRTDNYRGRLAYVVEISSPGGPEEIQWIDAERRVLLKTLGPSYELVMVEGIPLD